LAFWRSILPFEPAPIYRGLPAALRKNDFTVGRRLTGPQAPGRTARSFAHTMKSSPALPARRPNCCFITPCIGTSKNCSH